MTNCDRIPFCDLITPHRALEQELVDVFRQVLSTAEFIGGSMVERFEAAFAELCTTQYSVAVSSGTDALRLALIATGVMPSTVVVTVPHTFIATTEAITQAGAVPEFIDIDERTYNMSADSLRDYLENNCTVDSSRQLISKRSGRVVTAIVPVHLYGQMVDMDAIMAVAEQYRLIVVEDACQAHGAEYWSRREHRWRKAGSVGHAAAFSFYPGKNLGACGEAGAVSTNDAEVARLCRMIRDHGQAEKYYHDVEGYNGRLDALQAGILYVKLHHLVEWNEQRRAAAAEYKRLFNAEGNPVMPPYGPAWSRAVHHLYVVRTLDREGLIAHLKEKGIGTGIHYPIPLHLQKAYRHLQYQQGNFPIAERVTREIVSLPMFPNLQAEQQHRVVQAVSEFVENTVAPVSANDRTFSGYGNGPGKICAVQATLDGGE